ncbi:MAG: hypothetical protein J7604_22425 [Sporocytophaga sp.]|nr:hypothetical protein [Sporocytophaga sp.]MBO9702988.1 hypothetical protein [Sporocytophaga sp.]
MKNIGDYSSIEEMFQNTIDKGYNLALIDCNGNVFYLHEPDASDCNTN